MATVVAYFDESKDSKGMLAIAGYVAPAYLWDEDFSAAWTRVLRNGGPRPLKEFKASDCRSGFGEFADWTIEQRTTLTTQLVDLLVDGGDTTGMFGVGAGVFGHLTCETDPELEPVFYLKCLRQVVSHVFHLCDFLEEEDTLQFVFDERCDIAFRASQAFDKVVKSERGPFKGQVPNLRFGRSHELPPLQAADLLAYETFKEMKNRFGDVQLPVSVALHRLISERFHVAQVTTHAGLIADRFVEQSRENTDRLSEAFGKIVAASEHFVLYASGYDVRPPRAAYRRWRRLRRVFRVLIKWALMIRTFLVPRSYYQPRR